MISKILRSDNTEIQSIKSVRYEERVNSTADLRPGCVSSAYIQVVVYGAESDAPSVGEPLRYYQVDANGNDIYIGTFYAEPSVTSKNTYSFVAFDIIDKLDVDFSERLLAIQADFPMTLADLVTEACTVAGVQLLNATFPMYDTPVQSFYVSGLTCRDILSYAAEIACRFVRCDSSEKVVFDWYASKAGYTIYPTIDATLALTTIAYKNGGLSYREYNVNRIGCVAVKPVNAEYAAYIYPSSFSGVTATDPLRNGVVTLQNITAVDDGNGNITMSGDFEAEDTDGRVAITSDGGSEENALIIANNILLTNATSATMSAVAQHIYTEMTALPVYRPATAQLFPMENPFRAGDIVAVTDRQGVSFVMPIMSMSVGPSAAVVEATGNTSYDANYGTDTAAQLQNLANSIVQIDRLKVGYAEIDTAVVDSLEANGINADWINAGALEVKDANDNTIFKADKDNHTVTISGWSAGEDYLESQGDWMALKLGDGRIAFGQKIALDGMIYSIPRNGLYYNGNGLRIAIYDPTVQQSCGVFAIGDNSATDYYALTVDNSVAPYHANHQFSGDVKIGYSGENNRLVLNGNTDIGSKIGQIGNLASLSTTAKSDLVAAINELYAMITS